MIRLIFLFSLILLALSRPALTISIRIAGQTLESCGQDSDCLSDRVCRDSKSLSQCSASASCICVPPTAFKPCSNSNDCEQGELCAAGLPQISYNCVSDRVVASTPRLREVNAATDKPRGPTDGLTLAQCRTDLQCRGNRQCSLNDPIRSVRCSENAPSCACTPRTGFRTCTATTQCLKYEICVRGVVNTDNVCIARIIANVNDNHVRIDTADASGGLTFDPCRENSDCKPLGLGPRWCIAADNKFCVKKSASCRCRPFDSPKFCGGREDCPNGEVCAKGIVHGTRYEGNCMSSSFVNSMSSVDEYNGPGKGGTMLPCLRSGGCESDKTCVDTDSFSSPSFKNCMSTSFACLCAPKSGFTFCDSSTKCANGEACATNPFVKPICVSQAAIDDESTAFKEV